MRAFWVVVFMLLLLSQLVAWLAGRFPAPGLQPLAAGPPDDLNTVAEQTCEFLKGIIAEYPASNPEPEEASPAGVFEREQLMLQLRDAESVLSGSDAHVMISSELEAWIQSSTDREGSSTELPEIFPYMAGLLSWLESFPARDERITMERSFISPESTSRFPCLSFELNGPAIAMGAFLLEFEQCHDGWNLRELDLNRGEGTEWWIRGSFAFGREGL